MLILYGTKNNYINVTDVCFQNLLKDEIITIPSRDINRANLFTDPCIGLQKKIFIIDNLDLLHEFNDTMQITINTMEKKIIFNYDVDYRLYNIHSNLSIKYGSLMDELPEQKMVAKYIVGFEKILEIGGNIGRNSLVISTILKEKNNKNFVCLESDPDIAKQLIENRDLNNLNFHVENSALSKRCLIQKEWLTVESNEVLDGYIKINTITLNELYNKYNIQFNTLILDCEGAFYEILLDFPEILDNVNLIIMENDYTDINKKNYIDKILIENTFKLDYKEGGGWGPCQENFFEVWKK
jgi:FkbM family methyltransferase